MTSSELSVFNYSHLLCLLSIASIQLSSVRVDSSSLLNTQEYLLPSCETIVLKQEEDQSDESTTLVQASQMYGVSGLLPHSGSQLISRAWLEVYEMSTITAPNNTLEVHLLLETAISDCKVQHIQKSLADQVVHVISYNYNTAVCRWRRHCRISPLWSCTLGECAWL